MAISKEMQIGKAGEYLVCADLIIKGFVAYPSEQGLPYDVVMDNGEKLLKVQVKTCSKPIRTPQRKETTYNYVFDLSKHGKRNKNEYLDSDIDLFALVTLDTKMIGYVSKSDFRKTMTFRVDSLRGNYYDEKKRGGVETYRKVIELYSDIKNQSEIARILNIHVSEVNRICKPGYKPYITNAKYFSDIQREAEWFYGI